MADEMLAPPDWGLLSDLVTAGQWLHAHGDPSPLTDLLAEVRAQARREALTEAADVFDSKLRMQLDAELPWNLAEAGRWLLHRAEILRAEEVGGSE